MRSAITIQLDTGGDLVSRVIVDFDRPIQIQSCAPRCSAGKSRASFGVLEHDVPTREPWSLTIRTTGGLVGWSTTTTQIEAKLPDFSTNATIPRNIGKVPEITNFGIAHPLRYDWNAGLSPTLIGAGVRWFQPLRDLDSADPRLQEEDAVSGTDPGVTTSGVSPGSVNSNQRRSIISGMLIGLAAGTGIACFEAWLEVRGGGRNRMQHKDLIRRWLRTRRRARP